MRLQKRKNAVIFANRGLQKSDTNCFFWIKIRRRKAWKAWHALPNVHFSNRIFMQIQKMLHIV
jgi:hypothetical protein